MVSIFAFCVSALTQAPVLATGVDKTQVRLFHDGKGHRVAVQIGKVGAGPVRLFVGDDKGVFEQRKLGFSRDKQKWHYDFWDPRIASTSERVVRSDGAITEVLCGKRAIPLTEDVDGRARFLETTPFYQPMWSTGAFILARDNAGLYFYVDSPLEPPDNTNFRVYSGMRGKMKRLKMTNLVADSEGYIFSTPGGSLRVVLDKNESFWEQGKKKTSLVQLVVEDNLPLIYNDLGVYDGEPFGTACDML